MYNIDITCPLDVTLTPLSQMHPTVNITIGGDDTERAQAKSTISFIIAEE